MSTVLIVFWLTCCAPAMGILGFWVGRCARKIPIVDNRVPWAMRHYRRPQPASSDSAQHPPPGSPCCDHTNPGRD